MHSNDLLSSCEGIRLQNCYIWDIREPYAILIRMTIVGQRFRGSHGSQRFDGLEQAEFLLSYELLWCIIVWRRTASRLPNRVFPEAQAGTPGGSKAAGADSSPAQSRHGRSSGGGQRAGPDSTQRSGVAAAGFPRSRQWGRSQLWPTAAPPAERPDSSEMALR